AGIGIWSRRSTPSLYLRGAGEFRDVAFHRLRPDAVAGFLWMKEIGHDFLRQCAVLSEERGAEVQPVDVLAVGKVLDAGIDGIVDPPQPAIGLLVAREHR